MSLRATMRRLSLQVSALFFGAILPLYLTAGVLRVQSGAPTEPPPDGATWGSAFPDPESALARASAGDEIWIASGTYSGRLEVKSGVALYGGFAGNESLRDERQPERRPTLF